MYTATVTKAMTIREKKSTSAKKLGSVEAGEFINVLEFGKQWALIEKDGVKGYVLSKNVDDLAAAEGYNDEADAQYLGTADKDLAVRAQKSKSAQKRGTLPCPTRSISFKHRLRQSCIRFRPLLCNGQG